MVTTGIRAVEFGDGRAVFELEPAEWQYNPIGSVHGGVLTTLADSALGCAVHTKLGVGRGYTSLELKINFTRAVTVSSGPLRCVAWWSPSAAGSPPPRPRSPTETDASWHAEHDVPAHGQGLR